MANERRTGGGFVRGGRGGGFRSGREGLGRDGGPEREMFDGTCSQCGAAVQVPFRPSPDRPLLCRDCLRASRESGEYGEAREARGHGGERHSAETFDITCSHCGKKDTVPFRPFDGSVVLCRECMENPNIERIRGKILHTIICAVCGKENKVPFKPDPGSRVLCRECHTAERERKAEQRAYYAKHHPNVVYNTKVRVDIRCERCGCVDTLPFVPKTSGQILCRQCAENLFGEDWARRNRVSATEYPFTCARCAAQDFVPFKPKEGQELLCRHCLNDQAVLRHRRDEMQRHDAFTCVRPGARASEHVQEAPTSKPDKT